jgi:hypothetical protein
MNSTTRKDMGYTAHKTGQIVTEGDVGSDLVIHEVREGGPLCNTPIRDWHGRRGVFVELGPGEVTCGNCARTEG